jgi:hypothetical protein
MAYFVERVLCTALNYFASPYFLTKNFKSHDHVGSFHTAEIKKGLTEVSPFRDGSTRLMRAIIRPFVP